MNNTRKPAFTLIELLVVIAIIALLLSIIMPALKKTKSQAHAVICRSNLKQWGAIFMMYAQDNDSSFPQNVGGDGLSNNDAYWCKATLKYYEDPKVRFCPACKRNKDRVSELKAGAGSEMTYGNTFMNWGPFADPSTVTSSDWWDLYPEGSYGMNEWCSNPPGDYLWEADVNLTWRKVNLVKTTSSVPLFLDCKLTDTYPLDTSPPPNSPEPVCTFWDYVYDPMLMICMDRHNGGINSVYVDMSAGKIELKQLWKKKWHLEFNTSGIYTQPDALWPHWMLNY